MSDHTNGAPDLIFVYDRILDEDGPKTVYRSAYPRTSDGLYPWGSQKRRLDEFDPFLSVGGFYRASQFESIVLSTDCTGRRIVTGVPYLSPSKASLATKYEVNKPDAFLLRSGDLILRKFGSPDMPNNDEVAVRFWAGIGSPRLVAYEDRPADVYGEMSDVGEVARVYSRLIGRLGVMAQLPSAQPTPR